MSVWYRVYSRFYKIVRGFYRLQKLLRFSIPAVRPAFKYFATNSHTRFSYIIIRCCNLTSITDFFSLFVLLFEAYFFFLVPHFIFYRESFSFFLSTKLISWYKSFFWFLCIKALLSPPLLGRQPNLFVKRSLNLDSYLFSRAWKSLSISFALSPSASTFIFCFAWKILSIRRAPYAVGRQQPVFLLHCRLNHQYFSLRENFSLFEVFPRYLLSFYCRCIDIYHPFSLPFSFYFFVKTTLILYLTSNFFFLRENHSLFFILFLDKAHLYNGAALLFLCPVFFFFFVKSSLRSLLRSSYIWHCCVPCCSFFCLREIFSQ